jgi:hypothetical protein
VDIEGATHSLACDASVHAATNDTTPAVGQRLNDNTWDLDVYMPYVQNVGGRWKDLGGGSGVWPS